MTPLTRAALNAGISYRQADYWCRAGYIHAPSRITDQGRVRELTPRELDVFSTVARLVNAGLRLSTAVQAARDMVNSRMAVATIAPGVHVLVTDRPEPLLALTWQDTEHHDSTQEAKEAV